MPEVRLLSPNTFVPISTIVLLIGLFISGYVWLDEKFDMLVDENRAINTRILLLDRDLNELKQNRWTDSQMSKWVSELQRANPTIQVPDVD